jgi:sec-independent protein translocase protein TatA
MDFLGIGPLELVLIILIAFLIFGPGKLPEIARGMGKTVREFRRYSSAMTRDLRDEIEKEAPTPDNAPKPNTPKGDGSPVALVKTDGVQPQDTAQKEPPR